jgi:Zn-dependent protease
VAQFGKLLRWLFGVNAILFCAISARYIWLWESALDPLERLSGYTALAGIYGAAFVLSGKGGSRARYWALAASALNIPFYWIVPVAWLWTAAGFAGLFVFSRQQTLDEMAAKSTKPPRLRGDGTSASIDILANILLFAGFLAADSYWTGWSVRNGLPQVTNFAARLLLIEAALLITTLAHEGGHALVALLVRMKLRRLVVGPIECSFRGGQWQIRFRLAGLLGAPGGVGVVPTTLQSLRYRHTLVAAAGPVASLALGLLAMWATISSQGRPWQAGWMLASFTSTFSLLAFLFNLFPMRPESVYSDGARIYQLLSRSPWSDVYLALSMGSCTLASPMRPRDCDIHVLERAAAFLTRGMEAVILRVQKQAYFHDSGLIPEAITALEEAEQVYADSITNLRADLHKSFVFANAFLKRDAAQARRWWDRMEANGKASRDPEYWFTLSALLWIEGDLFAAEAALDESAASLDELPQAGAYDYERDCLTQLRTALDATKPSLALATYG